MIFAQFATPPEELSVPLWPLVLLGIAYAVFFVAARVLAGRGDERIAGQLDTVGFITMLLAGIYTLIIGVYALAERSEQVVDAIEIMLIIFGFFALLLVFMMLLELVIGAAGRSRSDRRRRAPVPDETPQADPPPA